jgi:hypothetical protein
LKFENFFIFLKKNPHLLSIKNDKIRFKLISFFKNYIFLLRFKLKKLKLGKVTFELKYFFFANILLYTWIEMKYAQQDLIENSELKLENRLKALAWKWDFANVLAFFIITLIGYFIIKTLIIFYLKSWFPAFFKNEIFSELFIFTFKTQLISNHTPFSDISFNLFKVIRAMSKVFVDNIISFYNHFF